MPHPGKVYWRGSWRTPEAKERTLALEAQARRRKGVPARTIVDLTGQVFGRLTALEPVGKDNGAAVWRCACSCGSEAVVRGTALTAKRKPTRSCGCSRPTHGLSKTPEYRRQKSKEHYERRKQRKRQEFLRAPRYRKASAGTLRASRAESYAAATALNLAARGISTSTAPIERGDLPPLCACHHEPMLSDGGRWRCGPDRREAERRREQERRANDYEKWREKGRRSERRRRAKLKGVVSAAYTRQQILERDGGRCRYCDALVDDTWHIAHLVALARGGSDTPDNVAVACATCNLADGVHRLPVQLHLAA